MEVPSIKKAASKNKESALSQNMGFGPSTQGNPLSP
jgi:hypothetical protein